MAKRGRPKGTSNKNKKQKAATTSTTTTTQKQIKWASSCGIRAQKLFIAKILATDVDHAQSSDKKLELAEEVIKELNLSPPWTGEKIKKKFMNETCHITGTIQADPNPGYLLLDTLSNIFKSI